MEKGWSYRPFWGDLGQESDLGSSGEFPLPTQFFCSFSFLFTPCLHQCDIGSKNFFGGDSRLNRESPSPEGKREASVGPVGFWKHAAPGHQSYV
eukprot:1158001-Pelagomonas_calceolata.AAC.9